MKKYEGYEQSEAFTGEYEVLEPGGYECKILKVVLEEKDYGDLLRIGFDITEGEHKGYYKRQFDKKKEQNPEAKWQGMYYQTIKKDDLKYFKGFITAIENSNNGFTWDWDENKLVGKVFGGIFGQEEFIGNGSIKLSTKCRFIRSIENVKSGNFQIPDIKKISNSQFNMLPNAQIEPGANDELPF